MLLKVSSKSNPNSVAGALANTIKDTKELVEINAIGAGAVNQAVKAIIIARGYLSPIGINIVCTPAFTNADINGEAKTGIKFICKGE